MFKDLGLNARVLLLTLIPSTALALLLGTYLTWSKIDNLQGQLQEQGAQLVDHLAPLAAPALARNDAAQLKRLAESSLNQDDVRSAAFLSAERQTLAHAGATMRSEPPLTGAEPLATSSTDQTTRFLLPVFSHHQQLFLPEDEEQPDRLLGWVEIELSHASMLVQSYRSILASLVLIICSLAVTTLFTLRFSHTLSAPLNALLHGINRIKEGDLETRLPTFGNPEFDQISSGINRMAASLQNAQDEMLQHIDQATEDVRLNLETIEIQNIELDLARKEALEASRIKSEFLANMSHEIRTPLNGILGFTSLLNKSELSPRQRDYLSTIETSANSLMSIINEVLDFSKIEAGKLVLEHLPFNLRDLIQDTLTILAPSAHEKNLELVSLIYRDTPLSLQGDPQRLKQVLTNLVGNAIKFTRDGSIIVRAMLEDENNSQVMLRISVQDSGVGLSQSDLQALFQAFSQADNSLSRQAGGSGLGLAICKRLIEQMGGEIGVESQPGSGSQFWVSLTLDKAQDDREDLTLPTLQGRRVAVLESHELAQQALVQQLQDAGLLTLCIESLDNLEALLPDQPIDLAVLAVNSREFPAQLLAQQLASLEHLGCKTLLLCPTTDQALYLDNLPQQALRLQSKPICTRKLLRALSDLITPNAAPSLPQHVPSDNQAPHILCVDDNPANLLLVKTLLQDLGAQVTAFDNAKDAVKAVQEQRFDLALMDVQMPEMDGRQATEAIRQWESTNQQEPLPIIALTAHALANERRALLQSGMDDYLTKPISDSQLAQVILKWTGTSLPHHTPTSTSKAPSADPELPVLDHAEGLRLAAGKADLAADMLAMLLAGLNDDRRAINQARERSERAALIERVHRLHGATRYCGVPQLRAACQRAETLLKQNNPAAIAALDQLDEAIARLAAQATTGA